MSKKQISFTCLVTAYLLMFAHAVIPHHHHASIEEADRHHQQEHATHEHDGAYSKGHEHTTHFVHSPDFETYVSSPSFKLAKVSLFQLDLLLVAPNDFSFYSLYFVTEVDWFPDLPPPYKSYTPLPNGLRGSPAFISLA